MTNPECRSIERRASLPAEVRAEGDSVTVVGHAAVFNEEAEIGSYFREIIRPGAFSRAIIEDDVPFLIGHEGLPLARNTSGTLKLSEDHRGLRIESQLDANDPDVRRIIPKMQRGDLNKMSFAFQAIRHEWQDEDKPMPLRIIHECRLFDVSIVTMPAYDGTDIGLRSLEQWRAEQEAERRRHNYRAANLRLRLSKRLDLRRRLSGVKD